MEERHTTASLFEAIGEKELKAYVASFTDSSLLEDYSDYNYATEYLKDKIVAALYDDNIKSAASLMEKLKILSEAE